MAAETTTFWQGKRVCVTGGSGFLGRVVCSKLTEAGCRSVMVPRQHDYDLTDERAVARMYVDFAPDLVIHLAAVVGGINANRQSPGRFFHANLAMGMHLIEHGRLNGVEKFVQIGTVCSYPKHCPTPFHENALWQGYPEETNAPYGIAKKALLTMLQAYREQYGLRGIFVMPVNLYGPHDNMDPDASHVIPALIRKFHHAVSAGERVVQCWGTGKPSREFLYVDDAANAILLAAEHYDEPEPINIGTGREVSIAALAEMIAHLTGYTGDIVWDVAMPDGQPRRCLDVNRAAEQLGWNARVDLQEGLQRTIEWWARTNATAPVAIA